MSDRLWEKSPLVILALGVGLFLVGVAHHAREILVLNGVLGPLAALFLDGLPALGLAYAGYWLYETDLAPRDRRLVFVWCLGGSLAVVSVIGATFLIRLLEGRTVTEPIFPLLIAADVGALAGIVAGYYNARTRAEAREARTVTDALAFVNDLIRHDLRNDLSVIQGQANLVAAERASMDSGTGSGDPEVIARKTDEALARIATTRAVAETLTGDPELEPVDLAAVAADLATQADRTFDVTVTTDLADRAPTPANAGLRSVVDNLLENAAEHNDADDPWIAVTVETDPETVQLTVRDNGPGIPDEQREILLTRRERGRASNGLALVRTLIDSYDGDIRIETHEPRGTAFVVTFPRADVTGTDPEY